MAEPPQPADGAEPLTPESDEETPHESATLPGTVRTVWSSILFTAYRRLGKGR
ncbi:hypothetical protein [Streptomyces sp. NPDC046979]|uniref:hypothetical protein n=1 Tax=Streptomyces sp. NPDC046979 TaxID=3154604 RepID=UPI00340E3FCE